MSVGSVVVAAALGALLLYAAARAWWALWLLPRSMERQLRRQGVHGTAYKLVRGDTAEEAAAMAAAWSRPIPLGHRIPPRAYPFLHQLAEKYGKMTFSWLGASPRMTVTDPELMKEVLGGKDGRLGKPPRNAMIALINMGVAALEGESWAKRRKLVLQAFHADKLKGMSPAFFTSCDQLVKRWERLVGDEDRPCEVDVWPEFQSLAQDVISRTAFGSCYEEGRRIFELQAELLPMALEGVRNVYNYIPGFRFIPTSKKRRIKQLDREIKAALRDLIRRKEENRGEDSGEDLLGLLLHSARRAGEDEPMTIDDVVEECRLFYFAGQETTAVLLTWTTVLLAIHQDWQQKVREEVLRVCGGGGDDHPPDVQALNHLRIMRMVLNEALRLYPPVGALFRHTYEGTKLGGVSVPAGVQVAMPTIFVHHDPDIWGEDAGRFNPERFSQGAAKAGAKEQSAAFFPFGSGPRVCLGKAFALIEAKMALAMILRRFSFELSPSYVHGPYTFVTMQPQYGAQIVLRRL